ncbi:ClpXP adapter SpxH family protein [Fictibacillus aquaticus]|uniref:ClpXP adapter protein SpxH n=1 Tax=Fictibacillus aquaticus TaxID=2021314 RepID=A0A235FCJ7_9BACL|nr:ClpXP adapter SpxH family protein [Fictibacillus aquaticus]OYD59058.1 dithiol-disulfide isomerase [Fictibacillus aquaticus]
MTWFDPTFPFQDNQKPSSCHKPLEIYSVIDPFCADCWSLEPVLKKLQTEYGQYFTLRHFISGTLNTYNGLSASSKKSSRQAEKMAERWERAASLSGMSCDGDLWFENPISAPYRASLAIKAAELQGKAAGFRYLRKMREMLFLNKQNIGEDSVLQEIAASVGLDTQEFTRDLNSEAAVKALQCDLKFSSEMSVTQMPTLIIFNDRADEEGIKVSGCYSYEVYVEVFKEMLGKKPEVSPLPSLKEFLKVHQFVATKEVSLVYNWTLEEAERQLKMLLLQQVVERIPVKHGTFWRYSKHIEPPVI